tara:strand:+ start:466 stop:657 length:192 start_codon:yes stop_codon:yes gene_type:complete
MKYMVIILLLSISGLEKIEYVNRGSSCNEIAIGWREVNTTYHGPGPNQGNYTHDGKLMIGYIC